MLTLWAMARSPLILGGNLTMLDAETLGLITNRELLRIDQSATASREVVHEGDLIAWTAELPDGEHALAVFNRGDAPLRVTRELTAFGVSEGVWRGEDAWQEKTMPRIHSIDQVIAPHGCVLLLLRR